jgi:hypothetical protein
LKEPSEIIPEGEAAENERLAKSLVDAIASKGRALHRKQHAGLTAELTTLGDLPEWARVGIFESPKTFRAYVRFSNGSGLSKSDRAPDVRGVAVKLVGVPGKKIIEGLADAQTQDFLGILTPWIAFRTPSEFVGVVLAASGSPLLLLPRIFGALGWRTFGTLPKLQAALKTKVESLSKSTFYSALPIRWGKTAAKYSFVPTSIPDPEKAVDGSTPNRLRKDLAARLARGPIEIDFRAQPFESEETTPIEDPTREWTTPWTTVGKLVIAKQDLSSERGKKIDAFVESLSFDPWHATADFRPLGAMMRARGVAYRESVIARGAAPEPDGTENF